jgi:hypothetical protein
MAVYVTVFPTPDSGTACEGSGISEGGIESADVDESVEVLLLSLAVESSSCETVSTVGGTVVAAGGTGAGESLDGGGSVVVGELDTGS